MSEATIDLGRVHLDTDEAARKADDLQSKLLEMQKKTATVFAKGFGTSALAGSIGDVGDALEVVGHRSATTAQRATALASAFAIGARAGVDVATSLAGMAMRLGQVAAAHESTERAAQRLGNAWDQVREQTAGTMEAQVAFSARLHLTEAGLRTNDTQLGVLARTAREYALRTGTEAPAALDRLTTALQTNDRHGLRAFGIAAAEGGTRAERFQRNLQHLGSELEKTAPTARTLAEDLTGTSRAFDQFTGGLAATISRALNLQQVLSSLADFVSGDFATAMARQETDLGAQRARVTALQEYSNALVTTRAAGRDTSHALAARDFGSTAEITATTQLLREAAGRNQGEVDLVFQARRNLRRGDVAAAQQTARGEAAHTAAASEVFEADERAAHPTAAAGPRVTAQQLADGRRELQALATEAQRLGVLTDTGAESLRRFAGAMSHADSERATHDLQQRVQAQQRLNDLMGQSLELRGQITQETREAHAGDLASLAGGKEGSEVEDATKANDATLAETARAHDEASSLTAQFGEQFSAFGKNSETAAQSMAKTAKGAFDVMTSALRSHIGAVIEGRESVGEALRGIAHETLMNLAQESAVKALFNTAQGIAALATQNYPGAAQFFAAAGTFAAVAAVAGLGAYATNPPAPAAAGAQGGGGPPAAASAGNAGGARSNAPEGSVVINVNGTLLSREGTEEAIVQGLQGATRRGLLGRAA